MRRYHRRGPLQTQLPAPTRSLPIVDVDSGLNFERLSGSRLRRTITLEPRLMYVYIPYRDQSQLPMFDTSIPDPNLIELFRPNRYRRHRPHRRCQWAHAGPDLADVRHCQRHALPERHHRPGLYFQPPRVDACRGQDAGTAAPHHFEPDRRGQILTAYHNWNLQLDVGLQPDRFARRAGRDDAAIPRQQHSRWPTSATAIATAAVQQIDASAAWPMTAHWDLYARAVYSLHSSRTRSIEDFPGFQYRGSCWSMRAVWQRSISTRTGEQRQRRLAAGGTDRPVQCRKPGHHFP